MDINREKAKELIAKETISSISEDEAKDILTEYWHYDCEADICKDIQSGELPELNDELIKLIISSEEPSLSDKNLFAPLFQDWKIFKLKYATNEYLENKLKGLGYDHIVKGTIENAGLCPCCSFYSIDPGEDGLWDICPVCFWENGGDGPNHMSIAEARVMFSRIGAISKQSLKFVEKDGPIKYQKNA